MIIRYHPFSLPLIRKSVIDSLDAGPLLGYPLTDVKVSLIGGSYHEDESTDMAFGISTSMAMRRAAIEAKPVLLEPVMDLEVVTPEEYLGDVISDLNSKRAKIIGVETASHYHTLKAHVPLSEMFGYSTALRSATPGTCQFHDAIFGI